MSDAGQNGIGRLCSMHSPRFHLRPSLMMKKIAPVSAQSMVPSRGTTCHKFCRYQRKLVAGAPSGRPLNGASRNPGRCPGLMCIGAFSAETPTGVPSLAVERKPTIWAQVQNSGWDCKVITTSRKLRRSLRNASSERSSHENVRRRG